MKKIAILMVAFATSISVKAQIVEAKINPLGLLFGAPEVNVEYGINERLAVEGGLTFINFNFLGFKTSGVGGRVFGKYYLGNDLDVPMTKYWVGGYLCGSGIKYSNKSVSTEFIQNNRIAVGIALGYKWLAGDNFVIEVGGGLGRAFLNDFNVSGNPALSASQILPYDVYSAFKIGWRFGEGNGGKKNKKKKKRRN
jgi:Protein of unknown function (DUF3575)